MLCYQFKMHQNALADLTTTEPLVELTAPLRLPKFRRQGKCRDGATERTRQLTLIGNERRKSETRNTT